MKNIPIWLCKLTLIVVTTFYWGVPRYICSVFKSQEPEIERLAENYKNIGFRGSTSIGPDRIIVEHLLDSILKKELDSVHTINPILTPSAYFDLLYRDQARRKEYGPVAMSFVFNDFVNQMHENIRLDKVDMKEFDAARDAARDKYEAGWREKETKNAQEFDEWFNNLPNVFLKTYWSNIFFAFFWLLLSFVSNKREWKVQWSGYKEKNPIPILNPLSIIISSVIWPYLIAHSLYRAYLEGKAHVEIRRTKINPFSLLSKDERALVKKFASSLRVERVEILKGIRSSGIRHSFGLALFATIVVSIMPSHLFAQTKHDICVSVTQDISLHDYHDWGDHQDSLAEQPSIYEVPLPLEKIIKQYFYFYQRIVKGVRVHLDHIPWTCVYIICSKHLVKHKNPKYEKNKNFNRAFSSINYC